MEVLSQASEVITSRVHVRFLRYPESLLRWGALEYSSHDLASFREAHVGDADQLWRWRYSATTSRAVAGTATTG